MKPPEAHRSDRSSGGVDSVSPVDRRITADNELISHTSLPPARSQTADRPTTEKRLTAGRRRPRSATAQDLIDRHVSSETRRLAAGKMLDSGLRSLPSITARVRFIDAQADNVRVTASKDTFSLHHNTDEQRSEKTLSDVMITNKTRETLINEETLQTTTTRDYRQNAVTDIASLHNDDTTTATITATSTTATTINSSTAGGDLDVFDVESMLPEMNWDRLEEQLRNAVQLEHKVPIRLQAACYAVFVIIMIFIFRRYVAQ